MEARSKIIVSYTLTFRLADRREEDERFCTEWWQEL
jgi:hypothetical protein